MRIDIQGEFRAALMRMRADLTRRPSQRAGFVPAGVTLAQVEAALQRLEEDTFGICSHCRLIIPRSQLLMRPYSELCPDCIARQENQTAGSLR